MLLAAGGGGEVSCWSEASGSLCSDGCKHEPADTQSVICEVCHEAHEPTRYIHFNLVPEVFTANKERKLTIVFFIHLQIIF